MTSSQKRRRARGAGAALAAVSLLAVALAPREAPGRRLPARTNAAAEGAPVAADDDAASDRPPLRSEEVPPEPPRTASKPPPQREQPAPPQEPPPPHLPPADDALLAPPDAPLLPIWAYDGALPPAEGAPTETTPTFDPDAPTRALQDPLRESDALVGLDLRGAGAIVSAIRAAVRAHTPASSVGTFRARVTSDGELLGIEVVSFADGSVATWQAVADEAFAALAGWRADLPGHLASGAEVTVHVEQSLERPSGLGRKRRGPRRGESPLARGVPKPGRLARREEPIVPIADMLPPDLAHLGDLEAMLPPLNADGSGWAMRFDLSDIGTHPARVVHARLHVRALRPAAGGPRKQRRR